MTLDPRHEATDESLNGIQKIICFFLILVFTWGYDAWSVYAGLVHNYDTEWWKSAAISGAAFLLVFRARTFTDILGRVLDVFLPRRR